MATCQRTKPVLQSNRYQGKHVIRNFLSSSAMIRCKNSGKLCNESNSVKMTVIGNDRIKKSTFLAFSHARPTVSGKYKPRLGFVAVLLAMLLHTYAAAQVIQQFDLRTNQGYSREQMARRAINDGVWEFQTFPVKHFQGPAVMCQISFKSSTVAVIMNYSVLRSTGNYYSEDIVTLQAPAFQAFGIPAGTKVDFVDVIGVPDKGTDASFVRLKSDTRRSNTNVTILKSSDDLELMKFIRSGRGNSSLTAFTLSLEGGLVRTFAVPRSGFDAREKELRDCVLSVK